MKTTTIREAEPKDLQLLVLLCKEHAEYEKMDYSVTNKQSMLEHHLFKASPSLHCLVVENERGEIVGYSTFMKQFSTWDASFYTYLDCLFLTNEYRGLGIGKELMRKVKAHAKTETTNQVQWQTPTFNTGAIEFYHQLGANSNSKERFTWI